MCENLSFKHICHSCQELYLSPQIYKRQILGNIQVISFYKYEEIKELLHTKHTQLGFHIYNILAHRSMKLFTDEFHFESKAVAIAIDDNIKTDYSHTAILSKTLKSQSIKPLYNKLRAKNTTSYSGKSREFRLNNPRDFIVKPFKEKDVILVDDIVTTGTTLNEAIVALQKEHKEVLFCLTLCDVSIS